MLKYFGKHFWESFGIICEKIMGNFCDNLRKISKENVKKIRETDREHFWI